MSVDNIRNTHDKSCTEPDAKNDDPKSGLSGNPDQHQYAEGVSCDGLPYKKIMNMIGIRRDWNWQGYLPGTCAFTTFSLVYPLSNVGTT